MPQFGKISKEKLETCHPALQQVFNEVIKSYDCTVLCGFRDREAQNEAFRTGVSKLQWPYGEHNKSPSMAVDVVPYPIDWKNTKRFYHFAGFVLGVAQSMGIKLRWGGDWNSNNILEDQTFFDLPHFEVENAPK